MRGINQVTLVGRLGADVDIRHTQSSTKVATFQIATDESYRDRHTGEWIDRAEWHRIATFQEGLIGVLEKHAVKGRLTLVQGTLRTRRYRKDGETADRFSTEILIAPGGQVQFLEPLADQPADGHPPNTEENFPGGTDGATQKDLDDEIPF